MNLSCDFPIMLYKKKGSQRLQDTQSALTSSKAKRSQMCVASRIKVKQPMCLDLSEGSFPSPDVRTSTVLVSTKFSLQCGLKRTRGDSTHLGALSIFIYYALGRTRHTPETSHHDGGARSPATTSVHRCIPQTDLKV